MGAMGPRSPHRMWLLLATPLILITLLIMSWFHWLPGGWFLRNLVEAPAHRAERLRLEHRADRLDEFQRQAGDESPGQVVFLGSSTIEFFPLDTCFPDKPVVNRGIGEEPVRDLRARLRVSIPAKPASVVIYSGAVDFHTHGAPPEALTAEFHALLQALRRLAPGTPICILAILPGRNLTDSQVADLARANTALREAAEAGGQTFLDTSRPPIVTATGCLAASHSKDDWHLNGRGYEVLASWLRDLPGPASLPLR